MISSIVSFVEFEIMIGEINGGQRKNLKVRIVLMTEFVALFRGRSRIFERVVKFFENL